MSAICEECIHIDQEAYRAATNEDEFTAVFDNEKCNWCVFSPGVELMDNYEKRKKRKKK